MNTRLTLSLALPSFTKPAGSVTLMCPCLLGMIIGSFKVPSFFRLTTPMTRKKEEREKKEEKVCIIIVTYKHEVGNSPFLQYTSIAEGSE